MKKNQMLKMLIAFGLLGNSPAWAHMMYSNWLVGVTGGFSAQKTRTAVDVVYTEPDIAFAGIPALANIYDFKSDGFLGGAFIGYQQVCRNWLVGVEAELVWQEVDLDERFAFSDIAALNGGVGFGFVGQVHTHTRAAATLSSRFGFVLETMIPDVLVIPYLRLGVEANQQIIEAEYFGDPDSYPFTTYSKSERWPIRFILGGGFEFPIYYTGFAVRLEYVYHSKGQSLENSQLVLDGGIINPLFSTDINSETNTGKVAILWNFY